MIVALVLVFLPFYMFCTSLLLSLCRVATHKKRQIMKIVECVNSIDQDEAAHNEPPHLDLHCLSFNLRILNIYLCRNTLLQLCGLNSVLIRSVRFALKINGTNVYSTNCIVIDVCPARRG